MDTTRRSPGSEPGRDAETGAVRPSTGTGPADPRIGTLYGNYRLLRRLGEGGMGVVYEAEHQSIHRRAAVKVLNPGLAQDGEYAQRFLNEARAVNLISHPGLVEIFEFGQAPDGTLYYVMELLKGESLERCMEQRSDPWKPEQVVLLTYELTQAMVAAHEKGIIHRDLKPSNIMLIPDKDRPNGERVKILDFGIAKLNPSSTGMQPTSTARTQMKTLVGSIMGTALYMPPEQWGQAEDVDGRADVFALGVVLYELLSGQMPYKGNSRSLLLNPLTPLANIAPKVPARLSHLVDQMLEVTAAKRPTMAEILQQVAAMRPRRLRSRDLLMGGGVGAVLVVCSIAAWAYLWPALRPVTAAQMRQQALELLATKLQDKNVEVRGLAVHALGASHDPTQRSLLEPRLTDDHEEVAVAAATSLGQLGNLAARRTLRDQLPAARPLSIRLAAAEALAHLNDPQGKATLAQIFESGSADAKGRAAQRLISIGDNRGAALLWGVLDRAPLTVDSIKLLGRLAHCRHEAAQRRLQDEFTNQTDAELRLQLANELARLGDEQARDFLRRAAALELIQAQPAAASVNPLQARAGRLLANLGEPLPTAYFLSILNNTSTPEAIQVLAAQTLGDSATEQDSPRLHDALERARRESAPRLLVSVAGAVVQLTTGIQMRLAEQSLEWAREALRSDEVDLRLLGVDALTEQETPDAINKLIEARNDPESVVRTRVVNALARKGVSAALHALTKSLSDVNEDVRTAAVSAIEQVLTSLEKQGSLDREQPLREQLMQMRQSSTELDRVAGAALLVRLKDESGADSLRAALTSRDSRVRRIAVAFALVSTDVLAKGLMDGDAAVRLIASRRLVALHDERGMQYLRGQVAAGGDDSLTAYLYLRQAGASPAPPPGLATLLESGSLLTRYAALDVVQQMDGAEAIRLLKIAALDPAAVLRGRTVRIAAALYQRNRAQSLLDLVRTLRGDPEVFVRSQVALVLPNLEDQAKQPNQTRQPQPENPANPAVPQAPTTPPGKRTEPVRLEGGVVVKGQKGEQGVRYRIDGGMDRQVSDKAVPLPVGKHRLTYLNGAHNIEIAAGQIQEVIIPVRLVDQLFSDARDAASKKDWAQLESILNKIGNLPVRPEQREARDADLAYLRGALSEGRDGLVAALKSYSDCLRIPARKRRPETNVAVAALLARIGPRIVRMRYARMNGSVCEVSREELIRPGPVSVEDSSGKLVNKTLPAGHIEDVGCTPK